MARSPLVADIAPLVQSLQRFTPQAREDRALQLAGIGQQQELRDVQIQNAQATQRRNQIIDLANENRVELIGDKNDLAFALKDGAQGLRNNLAQLAAQKGDDSPDMAELVEFANMAVNDPEGAFAQLEKNQEGVNFQLKGVDEILGRTQPAPTELQQAQTAKTLAQEEQIRVQTANLKTNVISPQDALKLQELQLKIQNQQAIIEDRKQKAVNATEQRNATAVANAFDSQSALDAVDSLLKDDRYKGIYGTGEQFIPTIFADAIGAEALRDQIVGLLSLESRQKLKGQGTISEGEAKTLAQSATILSQPGISESTALKELRRVQGVFTRSKNKALKNPEAARLIAEQESINAILSKLPVGSVDNGDGTFTVPSGEIVVPE